jgi:hypothetical protein
VTPAKIWSSATGIYGTAYAGGAHEEQSRCLWAPEKSLRVEGRYPPAGLRGAWTAEPADRYDRVVEPER